LSARIFRRAYFGYVVVILLTAALLAVPYGTVAVENGELTGEKGGQVLRRTWSVPGAVTEMP